MNDIKERVKEKVRELEKTMHCNCDLDNWTPEQNTGHSWVCRIHQHTIESLGNLRHLA